MNSINKHRFSKIIKLSILLFQVIFAFGFSFSQNTVEKCCHQEKKVKKHSCSCCMEEESKPMLDHCNSDSKDVSYTSCNCIHNLKSSNEDITVVKNYELTKFVNILHIEPNMVTDFNKIILVINLSSANINSPPIFISHSSLLI